MLKGGVGVDCLVGPAAAEMSKVVALAAVAEMSVAVPWVATGLVAVDCSSVAG